MSTVMLEADAEKLRALTQAVQVCDANGEVLGTFLPRGADAADADVPYTEDEIRRRLERARTEPGFTTAQVRAHLRGLGDR